MSHPPTIRCPGCGWPLARVLPDRRVLLSPVAEPVIPDLKKAEDEPYLDDEVVQEARARGFVSWVFRTLAVIGVGLLALLAAVAFGSSTSRRTFAAEFTSASRLAPGDDVAEDGPDPRPVVVGGGPDRPHPPVCPSTASRRRGAR